MDMIISSLSGETPLSGVAGTAALAVVGGILLRYLAWSVISTLFPPRVVLPAIAAGGALLLAVTHHQTGEISMDGVIATVASLSGAP